MKNIFFVKPGCDRCDWIKRHAYLANIEIADVTTAEGRALLAYHECVAMAEKGLPILFVRRPEGYEVLWLWMDILVEFGVDAQWRSECEGEECKL